MLGRQAVVPAGMLSAVVVLVLFAMNCAYLPLTLPDGDDAAGLCRALAALAHVRPV